MRWLFLTLWLVSLSGCATTGHTETPLFDSYQHYRQVVADGQIVAKRTEFFTEKVLDGLDISSPRETKALEIGSEVARDHSHYEMVNGNSGCLTVNGNASDGDFVSVSLEYVLRDQRWLINSKAINFWEKKRFKGFADKVMCPKEVEEAIWREVEKNN